MFQISPVPDTTVPDTAPPADVAPIAGTTAPTQELGDLFPTVKGLLGDLDSVFECLTWAEEEIESAQQRDPEAADRIYHSFSLLWPTHDRMATEFVYRSHCRELLARVVSEQDPRPGTAAEACCAMLTTSMSAPLRSSAVGLYMRMWIAARFPEIEEFGENLRHHEALQRAVIDEHEHFVRRQLAVPDRRLGDVACAGRHHGQAVACVYATPEQLTLPD